MEDDRFTMAMVLTLGSSGVIILTTTVVVGMKVALIGP